MNQSQQSYLIGALAGLATILLALSMVTGSGLSIILYLLSPLPIMVASLGWGVAAGLAGVVVVAAGLALAGNVETAIVITMTTALPAAMCGFLLGLSRPAEEVGGPSGHLAWYPLSDVIFRMSLMIAAGVVVAGIIAGYGPDLMTEFGDEFIARLQEANPEFSFSPEARTQFIDALTGTLPFIQPILWLLVMTANLYFALALARNSGRLQRPRDVWPTALRMPKPALIALGIALAASFFGGAAGLVAAVFSGALLGGFTMAGFAVMHERTLGKPWRPQALVIIYFSVAFTFIAALPFTVLGLIATATNMPVSPGGRPPSPPSGPPTA